MAITATKISSGKVDGLGHIATYRLLLDDSWLAVGEAVDLTGDFTEIHAAFCSSATVVGNHAYKFDVVHPAAGTAIAAGTVLVSAYYSTDAAGAFTAVPDATDLSAVVELRLTVIGKGLNPSNHHD